MLGGELKQKIEQGVEMFKSSLNPVSQTRKAAVVLASASGTVLEQTGTRRGTSDAIAQAPGHLDARLLTTDRERLPSTQSSRPVRTGPASEDEQRGFPNCLLELETLPDSICCRVQA